MQTAPQAEKRTATILRSAFLRLMRNDDNWRIQGEKAKERQCPRVCLLPLHQEIKVEMSRTLYSPRGTGSPVIISYSKIFFETGLGGTITGDVRKRENRIRPILNRFCSRSRRENPRHTNEAPATS